MLVNPTPPGWRPKPRRKLRSDDIDPYGGRGGRGRGRGGGGGFGGRGEPPFQPPPDVPPGPPAGVPPTELSLIESEEVVAP